MNAAAGVVVDRVNANVPDVAVSCDERDRKRAALTAPKYVFEVSSPKRRGSTRGRRRRLRCDPNACRVPVVDRQRRSITVYRRDAGLRSLTTGTVTLLDVDPVFA